MRRCLNVLAAALAAAVSFAAAAAPVRPTRLEEIPVPSGGQFRVVTDVKNDLGDGRLEVRTQYEGNAPIGKDPVAAQKDLARFYEDRLGVNCGRRAGGAPPEGPPSAEAPVTCERIGDQGDGMGVGFRWAAKGPDGLAAWQLGILFGGMKSARSSAWTVLRIGTVSAAAVKTPGVVEMGMPAFPGAKYDAAGSGNAGALAMYRFTTSAAPQAVAKFYEGALKAKVLCVAPDMCMGAGSKLMIKREGDTTAIVIQAPQKR